MSECVVFVDTCICLHYPPFRDVDWRALCGTDTVRLVFCMPVLTALDRLKDDRHYKLRAVAAIRQIHSYMEGDGKVRDGVFAEILSNTFRHADYPPELNPEHNDDQILLFAIRRRESDSTAKIVVAMSKRTPLKGTTSSPSSTALGPSASTLTASNTNPVTKSAFSENNQPMAGIPRVDDQLATHNS